MTCAANGSIGDEVRGVANTQLARTDRVIYSHQKPHHIKLASWLLVERTNERASELQ